MVTHSQSPRLYCIKYGCCPNRRPQDEQELWAMRSTWVRRRRNCRTGDDGHRPAAGAGHDPGDPDVCTVYAFYKIFGGELQDRSPLIAGKPESQRLQTTPGRTLAQKWPGGSAAGPIRLITDVLAMRSTGAGDCRAHHGASTAGGGLS